MRPISYLSGFCDGKLPPTIPPHGPGAALPDRVALRAHKSSGYMPVLPCAIERRGLDPHIFREEDK